MENYSNYIVYTMILSPIFAAAFITLIPTVDVSSKITLSRFFSLIGFISFLAVLYLFTNGNLSNQYSTSFKVLSFYVNFTMNINKFNIFLFGAIAASLLATMILYELNDTKSNTHQVAPFVLTFIIFTMLGQKDLRVALPIISITNFIIYFLIGYGEKIRRGTTIFHMGIFLFTCDTLVLILLQYQEIDGPLSLAANGCKIAAIVAGLARIGLPLCAPFMKNFYLNVDDSEGPFLVTYLHISGFAILVLIRSELDVVPDFLLYTVAALTIICTLYLALASVFEAMPRILSYYTVTFYSAIASSIIFIADSTVFWHLSSLLLLSNIACFLHGSKTSLMLSQHQYRYTLQPKARATWFLSLALMAGIPGFGIGAALWPIIYIFVSHNFVTLQNPAYHLWPYWAVLLALSILILSYALVLNYKKEIFIKSEQNVSVIDYRSPINRFFYSSPIIIEAISLLIPLTTFYVSSRVVP